jgi:hypothetical protein
VVQRWHLTEELCYTLRFGFKRLLIKSLENSCSSKWPLYRLPLGCCSFFLNPKDDEKIWGILAFPNFPILNYIMESWPRSWNCSSSKMARIIGDASGIFFFFFCGTVVWRQGFTIAKQALYCLSHASSAFCCSYFGDGVSPTICPSWPRTMILLISAPHVARIRGMSHLQ